MLTPAPQFDFAAAPDLSDPAQLARECQILAEALDAHAQSHNMGVAMGGVPNPQQFYRRCANALRLALLRVAPAAEPPVTDVSGVVTPPLPPEFMAPQASPLSVEGDAPRRHLGRKQP